MSAVLAFLGAAGTVTGSKTLVEVMELVHAMEEKFGVTAAAATVAAANPAGPPPTKR